MSPGSEMTNNRRWKFRRPAARSQLRLPATVQGNPISILSRVAGHGSVVKRSSIVTIQVIIAPGKMGERGCGTGPQIKIGIATDGIELCTQEPGVIRRDQHRK